METCIDDICQDVARMIRIDLFVVRESVNSWLARAADVLDEQGVVDLAELGRIHRINLAQGDEEGGSITVHRPYVDPMTGYHALRFDQHLKVGPVQPLR